MANSLSTKEFTLSELAQGLDVTIVGDPNCRIKGVSTIQDARNNHIAFLMNPLYKKYLENTRASAVILSQSDLESCPTNAVVAKDPYFAYSKIASYFDPKPKYGPGIHPTAVVDDDSEVDPTATIAAHCVIGKRVKIGPHAVISPGCVIGDDCSVGEGSRLDANVTIYFGVQIGKFVIISSGVIIGSDGFGLAKHQGAWNKVPQLGGVIIEDHVEIGANCAIDRGAIDDTIIEKGVKLDNLIQVGHNVRIGQHTAIAGCVGIAGSAVIGKNCLIGGGTGVNGHITIADNVVVTGMTEVTKSIREPGIYSSGIGGLTSNLEWKKNTARVHRLEQLIDRVKALETELAALKSENNE